VRRPVRLLELVYNRGPTDRRFEGGEKGCLDG